MAFAGVIGYLTKYGAVFEKAGFMDLTQQAKLVDFIRETLGGYVGQRLRVRANMGRSKIIESEGELTQVHPRLFVMEMDRKRGRTARQSYQYVDVLTGTVELSQNGEPVFAPFVIEPEPELPPIIEEAVLADLRLSE